MRISCSVNSSEPSSGLAVETAPGGCGNVRPPASVTTQHKVEERSRMEKRRLMHRREVSPPTLMVSVAFVPVKWLLRSMRHHRGDIFKGAQVVTNPAPGRLPNQDRYGDLSPTDTTGRPAGSCLGDSQGEGTAGPTARTVNVACVPARSIHRHACCSRSGDHGGRDRDLQLQTAHDVRG